MARQNLSTRRGADPARPVRRQLVEMGGDVVASCRDQHLAAGFEEQLDALPGIGDAAGAGAGGLEDARPRRDALAPRPVPVDVYAGGRRAAPPVLPTCRTLSTPHEV